MLTAGLDAGADVRVTGLAIDDELRASFDLLTPWGRLDGVRLEVRGAHQAVNAAQAARSGLPVYRAESGLKDVGAGLNLSYMLGRNWMVTAVGGYSRLMGDAADAPLVVRYGSLDQWHGGLFVAAMCCHGFTPPPRHSRSPRGNV